MKLAAIMLDNGCLLISPPDGSVNHNQLSFVKTVLDRTGVECWVEDIFEGSINVRFPEHFDFSLKISTTRAMEVDGVNINHPLLTHLKS